MKMAFVLIRLMCFGLLGVLTSILGYGIGTWQFWAVIIMANVIYVCGRMEEK